MNELTKFLVESILGEADGVENAIVVYAGRFQPFHKGHYATYQHLVKKFGKDNVFIGTSNKTDNDKSPFNFKEKKEIMTTMFGVPSNKIVQVKNPYRPHEILEKYDETSVAFITVVGEKDASRLGGHYFKKWKSGIKLEPYLLHGYVYVSPSQPNPISGTDVRNNLGKDVDDETKMDFFSKRAYPKFNKKIYDLITNKLSETYEPLFISKEVIEEWVITKFPKFLEEASQTQGKAAVDDGPNFFFPNYDTFNTVSQRRAEKIGYTLFKQIMDKKYEDYYEHPIYPKGPVKAVTPFPAGVIGKVTATNQKDYATSIAYDKWFKHVTRAMALAGYSLVRDKEEIEKRLSTKDLKSYDTMLDKKDPLVVGEGLNESMGLAMGYPSKVDLEKKLKQLKDLRKKLDSTQKGDEYYEPALGGGITEDIVKLNNSLNINRGVLPQIDKDELENYLEYLETYHIPFKIDFQPVASLNSSQEKIDTNKVKDMMKDDSGLDTPIIVSKDDYILDGHHRALAAFNLDKESEIPVVKVDLSLDELINISNEFGGSYNSEITENIESSLQSKYKVDLDIEGKLNEGKQVGVIYHYTDKKGLDAILKSNSLKSGQEYYLGNDIHFISFTRNKNFHKKGMSFNVKIEYRIAIDGNKLSNRYKIKPFAYIPGWDYEDNFDYDWLDDEPESVKRDFFNATGEYDEQEERITFKKPTKIPNIKSYILKVDKVSDLKANEGVLSEIPMDTLQKIDQYADKQLNPVDIVLTDKHFFDRLQDPRNKKDITPAELIGFFKRLSKDKKKFVDFLNQYGQIVAKDNRSKINIPFMKQANKVIAKTIMRKDNFKTSSPEYSFEDKIPGGLAGGMGLTDIAKHHNVSVDVLVNEFKKGISVEMEHTSDREVAKEIALDHLYEDPKYYTKLSKIEKNVNEDINIPVKVGDTVLMGKFKNKKVVVKDIGKDEYGMPTINGKKVATFRMVNEGYVEAGEPETGYVPDGKVRKVGSDVGRPEPWFEQGGYTQMHFPKADAMRGKGRGKDVESSFRKVTYKTTNVKVSALKKAMKPVGSDEWAEVPLNEGLLTEGGAYGHMNHPFDNEINLTFGQLKNIVNLALDGELELAREKTDGQALAISWVNGKLVAARNKGHLANRGANALDIKGVATKFSGRGELEKAYNFAMQDLSNAISKLSEKQREKIFKGGACFMNLEVIYPTSVNVIPYGQALLVFHGTMEYDEKGVAIGENQEAARILAGMIKQVNQQVQNNYTIQGPPITKLPKSQKLSSLKGKYNAQIQKLQSQFGLSDNAGISEYHQAWWTDFIQKKSPVPLDNNTLMGLVKRWAFYDKSFRLDTKNISDPKVLDWAKGIDKNDHAKMAKDNIRPFEDIFLGVGAEILSFMSSVLTANPDAAIRAMKDRLDKTIADVQKGGDPKKIAKLKLELERLNAIGGKEKIVPNEGIVFVYGGKTFKLTGTFAPLNQILGLFYEK